MAFERPDGGEPVGTVATWLSARLVRAFREGDAARMDRIKAALEVLEAEWPEETRAEQEFWLGRGG